MKHISEETFTAKVVAAIEADPKVKRSTMAKKLGFQSNAFDKRFNRLMRKGIVDHIYVSRREKAKGLKKFWILIETSGAGLPKGVDYQTNLCEAIKNELESHATLTFCDIDIMIGADWDIILTLIASNMDDVASFVTRFLRTQNEITRTRTTWSGRSH